MRELQCRKGSRPGFKGQFARGGMRDEKGQHGSTCSQADMGEVVVVGAKRAKLIEEISYQLTDLITVISRRVEILNERVPDVFLEDLQAIRKAAMKEWSLANSCVWRRWPAAE